MKRNAAGRLARQSTYLSVMEYAVFMTLLDVANNDTCVLPDWRTPSLRQLAVEAKVSKATVARALTHLERHGWVARERSHGGRGAKTAYVLAPETVSPCDCKHRRNGLTAGPFEGSHDETETVSRARSKRSQGHGLNGLTDTHVSAGQATSRTKGSVKGRTRVEGSVALAEEPGHAGHPAVTSTTSQRASADATARHDTVNVCAVADCPRPARRACRTCADHMAQEITSTTTSKASPDSAIVPTWKRGKDTVTVTYRADGWYTQGSRQDDGTYDRMAACCSTLARRAGGRPVCTDTVVWKVQTDTAGRYGGTHSAHYCDADLPAEDRPPSTCHVCRNPLDPTLAALGDTTHPGCEGRSW